MHPLWEEYQWPTKDADDKDLPIVEGIDYFYVNPYSGELSIEFPAQEQNCLGGILADEMGLGKTIEMLSLVNAHKYDPGDPILKDPSMTQPDSTGIVPAPYTTLVIAPTSLLAQWESEAQKSAQSGTMNTMVYYGTEQATNLRKLCCATNAASAPHVIVTSYGVVLSEYSSHVWRSRWQTESWYGSLFTVKFTGSSSTKLM